MLKKTLCISLAVLILLSVTATAGSAYQLQAKPDVRIFANTYYTPVNSKVTFYDASSLTAGKALWKKWYFGDSIIDTSTADSVSHIYTSPGTYKVTLKAANQAGSDISEPIYITVYKSSFIDTVKKKGGKFLRETFTTTPVW